MKTLGDHIFLVLLPFHNLQVCRFTATLANKIRTVDFPLIDIFSNRSLTTLQSQFLEDHQTILNT